MRNILIYLSSNIINASIPLLLLPVLTRYLTTAEYGQVAIYNTFFAFLFAIVGLNSEVAAKRKFYDAEMNDQNLKEFNTSSAQIIIISGFFIFIIITAFHKQISEILNIKSSWIIAAAIVVILDAIINLRLSQWQIRNQAKLFGLLQISMGMVNLIFSLLLIIFLDKGADGRVEAHITALFLAGLLSIFLLSKDKLLTIYCWKPQYIKENLRYGVPLLPHSIGLLLLGMSDRLIINQVLSLEEVGIYVVAIQLSSAMNLFFDAFNKAYIPWLFRALKRNDYLEKLKIVKATYLYFILVIIFSMMAFYLSPYILKLIVNENFYAASEIVGWLCLGQALGGMYLMVTNYILYSKKTQYLSLVTFISGIINIILLIIMAKTYGLFGLALAYITSRFIHFILTWYASNKCYKMPWLKMAFS